MRLDNSINSPHHHHPPLSPRIIDTLIPTHLPTHLPLTSPLTSPPHPSHSPAQALVWENVRRLQRTKEVSAKQVHRMLELWEMLDKVTTDCSMTRLPLHSVITSPVTSLYIRTHPLIYRTSSIAYQSIYLTILPLIYVTTHPLIQSLSLFIIVQGSNGVLSFEETLPIMDLVNIKKTLQYEIYLKNDINKNGTFSNLSPAPLDDASFYHHIITYPNPFAYFFRIALTDFDIPIDDDHSTITPPPFVSFLHHFAFPVLVPLLFLPPSHHPSFVSPLSH